MAIDQKTFFAFDPNVIGIVPLVGEALNSYQHVVVGLLKDSSLMGKFSLPPPPLPNSTSVSYINMMSSSTILIDPWIVRHETSIKSFGEWIHLSSVDQYYEAIFSNRETHNFSLVNWVDRSMDYGTCSDPLSCTFSTYESIMDIMMSYAMLWDENHHHSSFPDTNEDNLNGV